MKRKIRVGIVGANFGAKVHAAALKLDRRAEIVALASRSIVKAQSAAKAVGAPYAYGRWRTMLKKHDLDAVCVAVPPKEQPEIVAEALRQQVAVFAEKPLAVSLERAVQLSRLAKRLRVPQMVDYEFPEIPAWLQAKKILDAGAIGKLRHISLTWRVETYANLHKIVSWKTRSAEGGGTLSGFGCHALYAVEWFAGRICRIGARLSQAPDSPGKEDTLCVLDLELAKGAAAHLEICTHAFPPSGHEILFFGDQGQIRLVNATPDYARGFRVHLAQRKSPEFRQMSPNHDPYRMRSDGRVAAVGSLMRKFLDWVEFGKRARPDFSDALRVERLLHAARLSSRKNGALLSV